MQCIVFGAGPAGLSAAYVLARQGEHPIVLEKSDTVGGISRTICFKGYYFDLGGHRFFTKFDEVQALWEEVLGDEFLTRPRMSRIYYGGKFYDYPLRASNALRNLGIRESARCMVSYARARTRPRGNEASFEEWVSNRFGDRLFDIFFKSYTEKLWGIPTTEIGPEWASQRIKNLELGTAVKEALLGPLARLRRRDKRDVVTSLIDEFHYPRTGPGLMYDRMQQKTVAMGGTVAFDANVVRVEHENFVVKRTVTRSANGAEKTWEGDWFLSSMPLTLLIRALHPAVPDAVRIASESLTFRNMLTIDLIVDHPDLFPDNWIYVHEKQLQLGRIQNFKNWSPFMVPDPQKTSLGLEYFCSDHEPIWKMSTDELVALGTEEMGRTGLLKGARVLDGTAVRVPKAYPVYKRGYEAHLDTIIAYLRQFRNLQPVGRYGLFKYNNADHSILTALLALENMKGAKHDIWNVNTDSDYHEIRKEAAPAG
jgi:protoporphyrinogen oxidase